MSWLARSIANSLKLDNEEEEDDENREQNLKNDQSSDNPLESETPGRGVKEDLSELKKTLTRQLWGVASFLAPTPSDPSISDRNGSDPSISDPNRSDPSDSKESESEFTDSPTIASIRSDFAEIGGRFKNGISRLSSNKAVTEISKIASSFLPFGSDEGLDDMYFVGDAVGVTDEVLTFARNISMHPETWLDFPLFVDDEDSDDFDMSDAQQEHALAVERLAPRLAALRIELCPSHMSEGCFWKIYFVLLHSRLNKHDSEVLATPQIVEARAMLLQELQNRTKQNPDKSGRSTSFTREAPQEQLITPYVSPETGPSRTFTFEPTTTVSTSDFETEKHPIVTTEMKIIDKSAIEEGSKIQTKGLSSTVSGVVMDQKFEEEGDDEWLHEDHSELTGASIPLGNEEDVSFSDLEDNDDAMS
ncbi:uncharacterized protein LOC143876115 [Tasmannia lanceolata]|uniref:uncharacterized protein LOC143876115 n=1 Tax=Tasmannia lanceolata TaxID=3420 RepID=UPI004063BC7E